MTADAWQQVRHLLDGALALPRNERSAFLDAQCPPDLRADVEALLAHTSDPRLPSRPSSDQAHDPSPHVRLESGTRLSHYRIVRTLGIGGMGTVYLAFDQQLNRDVAIKVLKRQTDPRARSRLLREARAAAALDHPSICAVHEVGTDPIAGDFIVMQFIEGETLDERLQHGPLRPREALVIGRQLAEALSAAHAHGIVHRDLKPQNVIVDRAGRPRLLDFGIARALEPHHATTAPTEVTDPHAIVGTPPYMSPEQIQGGEADARSDLFSLGCVLYECLTGTRAFDGRTANEICGRVLHVQPELPSARHPDLHADHDALCLRLLAKEPAARFQSADEAVGALRLLETTTDGGPVHADGPVPRPPSPRRRLARAAVASVGGVALLTLASGLLPAWRTNPLPPAPGAARHWYEQGVAALRSGSYAGALANLQEAVRLHPGYAQAYSRLAEAYSELDDPSAAHKALVQLTNVVNESMLDEDERLRLAAVRASTLRDHGPAEQAFAQLAARHPNDSGALVDLARAQDAAGRWRAARDTLRRAVALNPQDAAAHLRLGVLESRQAQKDRAIASIDEAARLYRAGANIEGEAEALLRRGMVLNAVGDLAEAQKALQRVIALTADERYVVQRLRARFEIATVLSSRGQFAQAQQLARETVEEATRLQLETVAAGGLIDLADTLLVAARDDDANDQLEKAAALAKEQGANHTEMRARLQQASLRQAQGRAREALAMAEAPRAFFATHGYVRWDKVAKIIQSRAHEDLGNYVPAAAMADEVLTFAQSMGDESLAANAYENLAGVRAAQGQLPQALAAREHAERIHRSHDEHFSLAYDLVNHAELLVRLGRGSEAEMLLRPVDAGIASKQEAYVGRTRRAAMVRALWAATEGRDGEILAYATTAIGAGDVTRDSTALLGGALAAYARARLGHRQTAADLMLARQGLTTPPLCEVRYWLARGQAGRASGDVVIALVGPALESAPVQHNPELRWRLAATALIAEHGDPARAARWRAVAKAALAELRRGWTTHAEAYVRRADLAPLHALVQ